MSMTTPHSAHIPLVFVAPGSEVLLAEIGTDIDPVQREQLAAYGLAVARPLTVLQQTPMTVILADEVELAIEHAVARQLWVEPPTPRVADAG